LFPFFVNKLTTQDFSPPPIKISGYASGSNSVLRDRNLVHFAENTSLNGQIWAKMSLLKLFHHNGLQNILLMKTI